MVAVQLSGSTKSSGASSERQQTTNKSNTNKVKPSYKHIPHSQKPPHLVAKRNARERRRVQAVNQAFYKLRRCVPIENRNKRVSKVKTLQRAIDYIRKLERILEDDDNQQQSQIVLVNGQFSHSSNGIILTTPATVSHTDQQANSSSTAAQQTGKKRRTRAKCSTNCDQINQAATSLNNNGQSNDNRHQVQTTETRPRRGRKPAASQQAAGQPLTDNRLAGSVLSQTGTSVHEMNPQQAEARFIAPTHLHLAGHEAHKFTEPPYYGPSSDCVGGYQEDQAGEVQRESNAYNNNLSCFADQLEQHYSVTGQQHYLAADVGVAQQQHHHHQQHQSGHYFDMYQTGYPGSFYANSGSNGSHIGGAYSTNETSSSWSSYRQQQQQVGGWHEPASLDEQVEAGKANLSDSVASSSSAGSSGSASASSSATASTSLNSTSNGAIGSKPGESSSTSSSANLAVSFALLRSPSSASSCSSASASISGAAFTSTSTSANSISLPAADCSALSTGASSSSPRTSSSSSSSSSSNTLANKSQTSSPMALNSSSNKNNDNSSAPVVVRQVLRTAPSCNRQQVNNNNNNNSNCLAYLTANNGATHLSFAVNNGRDNNDNTNASYNHHNHQRQLLDERKSSAPSACIANSPSSEHGIISNNSTNSATVASSLSGVLHQHQHQHHLHPHPPPPPPHHQHHQHQVRHSGIGNNGAVAATHLNGGFSANNLHEQAHTLQYHHLNSSQPQQHFHHNNQHQHHQSQHQHQQQQAFLGNQQHPRSAHLSGPQPPLTLLDGTASSTTTTTSSTTTNSLVPQQPIERQTIQEHASIPLS